MKEIKDIAFADAMAKELGFKTGRVEVIDEKPATRFKTVGGRPDIGRIVREMVEGADNADLVAVGGTGSRV